MFIHRLPASEAAVVAEAVVDSLESEDEGMRGSRRAIAGAAAASETGRQSQSVNGHLAPPPSLQRHLFTYKLLLEAFLQSRDSLGKLCSFLQQVPWEGLPPESPGNWASNRVCVTRYSALRYETVLTA